MKNLQQLRDEAVRIRDEMQILRNTVEHWNRIHPMEEPIEPELYAPQGEIELWTAFIARADERLIQ